MNPIQAALGGPPPAQDYYVAKLNAAGTALLFSTHLGGTLNDAAPKIALDNAGNIYIAGFTASTDFPTVNPIQPAFGGGTRDATVTKINAAGSAILYSTYVGGSLSDTPNAIAVDSSGNVYVAGRTTSTDFPTANAIQPAYGGGVFDVFIAKIAP
ncbi:MAG: SBBP repeat-containing protein [Acidobacteria bacterium]|nr:SBBP repeat-containing protein [Acidobacteriota bacterium]